MRYKLANNLHWYDMAGLDAAIFLITRGRGLRVRREAYSKYVFLCMGIHKKELPRYSSQCLAVLSLVHTNSTED